MRRFALPVFALSAALAAPAPAAVASTYGTAEEAAGLAKELIAIIDAGGLSAGLSAVHDPSGPFQTTGMGVHIFDSSVIIADSRDPDLESVSYAGVADLDGQDFWDTMVAAANTDQNTVVRWYDYDDPSVEYTFNCHSEWQTPGEVMVWICR
ncbi:MAG: hypothetical protein AAF318_18935 [Pseudomonadota bacterium]